MTSRAPFTPPFLPQLDHHFQLAQPAWSGGSADINVGSVTAPILGPSAPRFRNIALPNHPELPTPSNSDVSAMMWSDWASPGNSPESSPLGTAVSDTCGLLPPYDYLVNVPTSGPFFNSLGLLGLPGDDATIAASRFESESTSQLDQARRERAEMEMGLLGLQREWEADEGWGGAHKAGGYPTPEDPISTWLNSYIPQQPAYPSPLELYSSPSFIDPHLSAPGGSAARAEANLTFPTTLRATPAIPKVYYPYPLHSPPVDMPLVHRANINMGLPVVAQLKNPVAPPPTAEPLEQYYWDPTTLELHPLPPDLQTPPEVYQTLLRFRPSSYVGTPADLIRARSDHSFIRAQSCIADCDFVWRPEIKPCRLREHLSRCKVRQTILGAREEGDALGKLCELQLIGLRSGKLAAETGASYNTEFGYVVNPPAKNTRASKKAIELVFEGEHASSAEAPREGLKRKRV